MVPKIAVRSSQFASFAGTMRSWSSRTGSGVTGRIFADEAVNCLAHQVRVTKMTCVLLVEIDEDSPEVRLGTRLRGQVFG